MRGFIRVLVLTFILVVLTAGPAFAIICDQVPAFYCREVPVGMENDSANNDNGLHSHGDQITETGSPKMVVGQCQNADRTP